MEFFEFIKAKPIWAIGREREMNLQLTFKAIIGKRDNIKLHLTGASVYRIFVNGCFVAIGPARSAHGYYKVDSFDLTRYLVGDENLLAIEVVGYNVNSFYTLDQPSFLVAEVERLGNVVAYTGGDGFTCNFYGERIQKVQRYSFQRPFAESYQLKAKPGTPIMEIDSHDCTWRMECHVIDEPKRYIQRDVPYPMYEVLLPDKMLETALPGKYHDTFPIYEDRSYLNVGSRLKGYPKEDLEEHLSTLFQQVDWIMPHGERRLIKFPYNATGMIAFDIFCNEEITVVGIFDEILINGDVDSTRLQCCNGIKLRIWPGTHRFISFEPYTLQYLKLHTSGPCKIENIHMIEYKHPPVENIPVLSDSRPRLKVIFKAALETFLSNSVDIFTDCPSRERAGWLCDSFFLGRVEHCLTGKNRVEKSFLENFVVAEEFKGLPEGMLPMCYPADHYDGVFIPNWAMWFVLELEEYYKRNEDKNLVDAAKEKVYCLLKYFRTFENELGLLENLESWVFVEWSKAAEFVQDVNYPSNMLYARMLEAVGYLYNDKESLRKSARRKEIIRQRSYNGEFFTDNEIRNEKILHNPNHTTEVCQYYAFFTGIATPTDYPDLWNTLCTSFGPKRKREALYPSVHFANSFIGNYLRLDLLYRYGMKEQLMREMEEYFYDMARETGTLWEHDSPEASCNHGFASHVIYWLNGIFANK